MQINEKEESKSISLNCAIDIIERALHLNQPVMIAQSVTSDRKSLLQEIATVAGKIVQELLSKLKIKLDTLFSLWIYTVYSINNDSNLAISTVTAIASRIIMAMILSPVNSWQYYTTSLYIMYYVFMMQVTFISFIPPFLICLVLFKAVNLLLKNSPSS